MKQLIIILLAATLVFVVLAMIQEPETFVPLFLPTDEPVAEDPVLPPEIITTLSEFNSVLEHYYRFSGDERFLKRLPASDAIRNELRAEITYLVANGIMQTLVKTRGSILSEGQVAPGVWELLTEEEWRLQYHDGSGSPVNAEPIITTIRIRYVIRLTDQEWQVVIMEPSQVL